MARFGLIPVVVFAAIATAGCGADTDDVRYPYGERYPITHTIDRTLQDESFRLKPDGQVKLDSVYQIRDLVTVPDDKTVRISW